MTDGSSNVVGSISGKQMEGPSKGGGTDLTRDW